MRKLGGSELLFRHNTGLHVGVNRIDGEIAVPCALLAALGSGWNDKKTDWPSSRGAPMTGMWLWQDANGDGQMAPTEFTDLSDGGYWALRGSGLAVDEEATIWHRLVSKKGGNYLQKFQPSGVNAHGCPQYPVKPQVNVSWPPLPFNETNSIRGCGDCGRLSYVAATDTMFVSDFTADMPQKQPRPGIGEEAGSMLCR
jgi:hypothetical protein